MYPRRRQQLPDTEGAFRQLLTATTRPDPPTGTHRIAVVAPPFFPIPPAGYGGIERVVSGLVDGLVADGHDVTLFAAAGSSTGARLVTPLESPPILGDPSSVGDELIHAVTAYDRAAEFDVIHDHTTLGPVLGASLEGSVPVVCTLHGPWTSQSSRLFGKLDRRLSLVAISHAQRAANPYLHYAGVVHNGVDVDAHRFNPSKEDFVAFVGRVCPDKRPELAIEVARRAAVPLVMVIKRSEPCERSYWDDVVAPRLGPDVEVLEEPPQDVKIDIMGRARALLFPIDWSEPFGLVMAESLACGTPVVARPFGAAPEVIEDGVTGFLRSSVGAMAKAVDAARYLSPLACRAAAERRFSTAAMVAGYERVYRTVRAGSPAAAQGRGRP